MNGSIVTLTPSDTNSDVISTDYRIDRDNLERKQITIREEAGQVIEIIVGLAFDPRTGEQLLAFSLTPMTPDNYQITAIYETVDNGMNYSQLLPANVSKVESKLVKDHISGANVSNDFEKNMNMQGMSLKGIPTLVKRIPLLLGTNG